MKRGVLDELAFRIKQAKKCKWINIRRVPKLIISYLILCKGIFMMADAWIIFWHLFFILWIAGSIGRAWEWHRDWLYYRGMQGDIDQVVNGQARRLATSIFGRPSPEEPFVNSGIPQVESPPTLLNSMQIEQLNHLRSSVSLSEVSRFPEISVAGKSLANVVPGSGLFSGRIQKDGRLENLVFMLYSMQAVRLFEQMYYANPYGPFDFWCKGYLLPSRAGMCYSVLLMTHFRFNGRLLTV
jgi:hypothetical protein